jgi:FAD/FMN-containing dehydrogenase
MTPPNTPPLLTASASAALLQELGACVGSAHVLATGDLSAWERDQRGRRQGKALAVVRPGSSAEVATVVRACVRAGVALVPQGGNTGLSLGATPDGSGQHIVLNLARLNRVRALDRDNLTLTAEAGVTLAQAQEAAAEADLLFPLTLASQGSCTIGGNLATNAGGTQVLRWGNARELCLGLEVVTAQGALWNGLSGLRKDNRGYDLRQLFIGSEGTLGIITAATLKLFARPRAQVTAWATVPTLAQAVALLGLARQHLGDALTGFEAMSAQALALVAQHLPQLRQPLPGQAPWAVLIEAARSTSASSLEDDLHSLLAQACAQGCALDAVVASQRSQAQQLWAIREGIPRAQALEGLNIKHDIALPTSRLADFVAHTDALLARHLPGVRIVNFGHLGDGNLHYNVQAPAGQASADFLRAHEAEVNALVYDAVVQFGGTFSAEHGVGRLKVAQLQHYSDPVALQLMHALKHALDPLGLMNPGCVLPSAHQKQ